MERERGNNAMIEINREEKEKRQREDREKRKRKKEREKCRETKKASSLIGT